MSRRGEAKMRVEFSQDFDYRLIFVSYLSIVQMECRLYY